MNIKIRKANLNDLKDIQGLSQKLIEYENSICKNYYTISLDWSFSNDGKKFFEEAIENYYVYVAEVNDKIVGYMTGYICNHDSSKNYKAMELSNLFVLEEYRNFGIGTQFINIFKKLCKENNINYFKVFVLSDNGDSIKFYKKHGLYVYNALMMCDLNIEDENIKNDIKI